MGNRESVSLPNGVVTTYDYDSLNRLINLTNRIGTDVLSSYNYQLHPTGRRTGAVETIKTESEESPWIINTFVGACMGAVSTYYSNMALGKAQTVSSIAMGAAWGTVFGPYAAAVPEIGVGIGLWGIYSSSSIAWEVAHDANPSKQKILGATVLVVGSIWGTKVGLDYAKAAGPQLIVAQAKVPDFPLPLAAPEGIQIEATQPRLQAEKVPRLPTLIEDMLAGKKFGDVPEAELDAARPSVIPRIGGYKDGNRYIIGEGHHRMTAALECYKSTGDPKYLPPSSGISSFERTRHGPNTRSRKTSPSSVTSTSTSGLALSTLVLFSAP